MSDMEFFAASDEVGDAVSLLADLALKNAQPTVSFIGPNYAVFVVIGRQYVKLAAPIVQEMHRQVVASGACLEHEEGTCGEDCGARPKPDSEDEESPDADV